MITKNTLESWYKNSNAAMASFKPLETEEEKEEREETDAIEKAELDDETLRDALSDTY